MISPTKLEQLKALIESGQEHDFYTWRAWNRIRSQVLELDHNECVLCRAKGRYARAEIVHHVKHLKDAPELALEIWDGDKRQLISVCKRCHERLHPKSLTPFKGTHREPLTKERWD